MHLPGQFDDAQPKFLDCSYYTQKLVKIDRFCNVAIGMKLIGAEDILISLRSRQDNDGDLRKVSIRLYFRQYLTAILIGQVQVQKYDIRVRSFSVSPSAEEEIDGFSAVFGVLKLELGSFCKVRCVRKFIPVALSSAFSGN